MVRVLPQPEGGEDGVLRVDTAVGVAAPPAVEFGQSEEAVSLPGRGGLRREVAEQLGAVVDVTVAVAVEREPRVVGASGVQLKPRGAVAVEVEVDAVGPRR